MTRDHSEVGRVERFRLSRYEEWLDGLSPASALFELDRAGRLEERFNG